MTLSYFNCHYCCFIRSAHCLPNCQFQQINYYFWMDFLLFYCFLQEMEDFQPILQDLTYQLNLWYIFSYFQVSHAQQLFALTILALSFLNNHFQLSQYFMNQTKVQCLLNLLFTLLALLFLKLIPFSFDYKKLLFLWSFWPSGC